MFVCQNSGGGKLVPELRKEHIQPGQFDTMDVRLASSLFSERMFSAGLRGVQRSGFHWRLKRRAGSSGRGWSGTE